VELLQKKGFNYTRLYESKIFRLTQPLAKIIERYFILNNLNLVCYKDQYKAECMGSSPLFSIPIFRIQSIEYLHKNEQVIANKNVRKSLDFSTPGLNNKINDLHFFKIVLDGPLIEKVTPKSK